MLKADNSSIINDTSSYSPINIHECNQENTMPVSYMNELNNHKMMLIPPLSITCYVVVIRLALFPDRPQHQIDEPREKESNCY